MATRLTARDLGRPIRVVVFGGAFFERAALELLARLDEHPEVEVLGGFCQSRGFAIQHRVADVVRRRKMLAPPVLGVYAAQAAWRFARRPRTELARRERVRRPLSRMIAVPDIHAPAVLAQVRALSPDLGLGYGSPLLKPALFEIPAFGTLGIHHGKLPEYRGKKTAFWAMLNGEATAGVTIQRINAGLDRGEIICAGEVPIGSKRYGRVDAEVQDLGVTLYMAAVLGVKRGEALCWPQRHADAPLYRQPAALDILRLWCRQLMRGQGTS
jgi:methionyl-tRNA formyltransferase